MQAFWFMAPDTKEHEHATQSAAKLMDHKIHQKASICVAYGR